MLNFFKLEKYLNVVQFGKNIFGVKKAAQFYFKKSPAHLDVVESAFLVEEVHATLCKVVSNLVFVK